MKIRGAVLEVGGTERPYAVTRPIRVQELTLDPPGGQELLVRIDAAGLCHSDLSVVDGSRLRPTPMLLGHEASGIVEALGDGVGDLRIGQRVVMTFLPRCESCPACATDGIAPCAPGSAANNSGTLLGGGMRLHGGNGPVRHHLGVSAFATHAVVSRRSVVAVDDDIPAEVAALLGCAVLTGGGAVINAGRPRPGDRLAVVGLGGVGMAALLTALATGGVEVIGVDVHADKLAMARTYGAHDVYTPEQAVEAGVEATIVIEAVGDVRAFETALAITGPGGRTVTVGLPSADAVASVSPLRLVARGQSIVGSYLGSSVPGRDIPKFVEMWRRGDLPLERLVSARIGLDDINAGMDQLAEGDAVRQLVSVA